MLRTLLMLGAGAVGYWAYKRLMEPSKEEFFGTTNYEPPSYLPPAPRDDQASERGAPESPTAGAD
jgi:hypothetical protein